MIEQFQLPDYTKSPLVFADDKQLLALSRATWLFDVELYSNYLLIAFMCYETGQVVMFEEFEDNKPNLRKLKWMIDNLLLIGFNSRHFDQHILWAYLAGRDTEQLKNLANCIILGEMKQKELESKFQFKIGHFNHIDLQQVAPAAAQQLSLKHYGARVHSKRLQELPFRHDGWVTPSIAHELMYYCVNDLIVTGWLYHKLRTPIQLRCEMSESYGTDLRSCSDAQIAEKAIGAELRARTNVAFKAPPLNKGEIFKYQDPGYLDFKTPMLQRLRDNILSTIFVISDNGKIRVLKDGIEVTATNLWKVRIGETSYTLGIGGLHSSEKKRSVYTTEEVTLYDRDVASYYPAIILNQGLYPNHIGEDFLEVYRDIVERRLKAKKAGDKQTSESLKICINGCFGKLGNRWSIFFSPHLLLQVTVSGQLSLLLLIESLELAGIPVLSANTDGIVIACPRTHEFAYREIVADWEVKTLFTTEEASYASLHSRDVNNYVAVTASGKVKAKGSYVNPFSMSNPDRESLMTNPTFDICSEAMMRFLQTHKSSEQVTIEQTIKSCTDITKFLCVRRVNGGAVKGKIDLGKVIRWYIAKKDYGAIFYKNKNAAGLTNKVAETDGGRPLMELPDSLPDDIDYSWYIRRTHSMLKDVGFYNSNEKQITLFD